MVGCSLYLKGFIWKSRALGVRCHRLLHEFKGLEADVVILVGIDTRASKHLEMLYVGASRARAALYFLRLEIEGLGMPNSSNL
ncbi:ATP-binding domain-containing protein [Polaromonas sp. DSR2-3-2]